MLGTSLTTIGGVLPAPAVVLLYWAALRESTPRLGLLAALLAAIGAIVVAGAISLPVVARAAGEEVQQLVGGTTYTIIAFILLLVGFILTAIVIYRNLQLSNWITLLVGAGPILVLVGGPAENHQLTASGFILLGAGLAACRVQLWPRTKEATPMPSST